MCSRGVKISCNKQTPTNQVSTTSEGFKLFSPNWPGSVVTRRRPLKYQSPVKEKPSCCQRSLTTWSGWRDGVICLTALGTVGNKRHISLPKLDVCMCVPAQLLKGCGQAIKMVSSDMEKNCTHTHTHTHIYRLVPSPLQIHYDPLIYPG